LAKHSIPVVSHPPCSPDLSPCNFFFLPRLKITLKGKLFQDAAEIQLNTTRQLQAIPKQAYQTYIGKWKDRWNTAYNLEGRALKEITLMLLFSYNKFCPGYFWSSLVYLAVASGVNKQYVRYAEMKISVH
jgi:hypothetical protein